ncbi:branched-chain amino acid ABC transporter permease [Rubrobacter taiwanensis]|uniref:branched-chain amino acid ABC transporter permease n=1 Tax=Rubrobacter taiwanensis TaxID=185139 RepID=UPI001FB39F3A|nr:branched-chain amino acid ABC transporter permease [Rubrobacter taiwanensis]
MIGRLSGRRVPWPGVAVLTLLVLLLPLVLPPFGVGIATEVFIMAIFAMSLGLILGYAGLVSLGHAAFFGAGAYTVALLGQYVFNTYLLLLSATAVAALLAAISGALFFRSTGAYFLMLTLAFSQVLFAVAFQAEPITGGDDGMSVVAVPDLGFGEIVGELGLYYMMGFAFLGCYLLLRLFVASPAGKVVKGIMENELRMRALGYNTFSYKLFVYTLAGAMAGFAGALYAYFNFYVTPDLLGWVLSGQALIMVIIGGVGTLLGPALGAAFFIVVQNYASFYTEYWALVLGLIFIIFVLLGRGGLMHLLRAVWNRTLPSRFREREDEMEPEEPAAEHQKERTP